MTRITASALYRLPNGFKRRGGAALRQLFALCAAAGLGALSACSGANEENFGTIGFVEGFFGGVVADEPQAVLVGRDVLSAGGTAADAATAMYFTMAATMPSSASLGGGGACVVFDPKRKEVQALDFMPRAPSYSRPDADRPTAIPGAVRGFYALQARYGRLQWSELLAPAENLARFGMPVSRAFAHDVAEVGDALLAEPTMRPVFATDGGMRIVGEGDRIRQLDLAAVMASIRVKGPGPFYGGALARTIADATEAAGGTLSIEDLRDFRPVWRETIRYSFGDDVAHFAPPPAAAGVVAAQMFAMLDGDDRFEDASRDERDHLLAETALRAFGDRARWMVADGDSREPPQSLVEQSRIETLMATFDPNRHQPPAAIGLAPLGGPENPSAATLVAVDRDGGAVACAVTLNSLFGTGRIAPGTGMVLAALPGPGGRGAISLGPMVLINENSWTFFFAAAAAGGKAAPTALAGVAARILMADEPVGNAIAAPRVHTSGNPDIVFVEESLDDGIVSGLRQRGHRVIEVASLGRVSAISCPGALPSEPESCVTVADPRGFGLAVSAD